MEVHNCEKWFLGLTRIDLVVTSLDIIPITIGSIATSCHNIVCANEEFIRLERTRSSTIPTLGLSIGVAVVRVTIASTAVAVVRVTIAGT